jgi:hypothetical protein
MRRFNCVHHVYLSYKPLVLHLAEAAVPSLHDVFGLSSACRLFCVATTCSTVKCQGKVQTAHQVLYGNLEDFQKRFQRCLMRCEDQAKVRGMVDCKYAISQLLLDELECVM